MDIKEAKYVGRKSNATDGMPWSHWWEYKDGSEGGELWLEAGGVIDYDGAFDLPSYVWAELKELGYVGDA